VKPSIYLAGAIRDGRVHDIHWRERFVDVLSGVATLLNPVGGKTYDTGTREWRMSGRPSTAQAIVPHDFWMLDHADIAVFNFQALAEGYPCIGSLVEFGRATARGCLRYSIVSAGFTGHQNGAMYALHPFLEQNSAMVFGLESDCLRFLRNHLPVLAGTAPSFGGYVK